MDTIWKFFIMLWVTLAFASCGAGIAGVLNPANYNATNYNTTSFELNILSGNTDTITAVGICIVLILIVRTLGRV